VSQIAGLVSTGQWGGVLSSGHTGGCVGGHCWTVGQFGGALIRHAGGCVGGQCCTVGQFGGALIRHAGGRVGQCWTVGQFGGALSTGHCGGMVLGQPKSVFGRHAPVTVGGGASVDSVPAASGASCAKQLNVGIGQLTPGIVATQSTVGNTPSWSFGTGQFEPGTVSGSGQLTYGIVFGMHDKGGRVGNGPNGSALCAFFAFGVDFAAVPLLGVDFFSATFFSSFRNSCVALMAALRVPLGRASVEGLSLERIESGALCL
jgi:hypothetical protein